jgi:anhydro-N-acetylmuramic acid kinase
MCTDIGPGNTLIDAACRAYFDKPFDEDSAIAYSGTVNEVLLDALLHHPFFNENLPKTTGPELFNLDFVADAQQATRTLNLAKADLVATLSAFTGRSIGNFIRANFIGPILNFSPAAAGPGTPL